MVPDEDGKEFRDPGTTFPFTLFPWITKREPSTTYMQLPKFAVSPNHIDADFITARLDDSGLLLQYSMRHLDRDNIKYPLARLDYERDATYYDLQFWLSADFVCITSETLEGYADSHCNCGHNLAHEKPRDVFSPCDHFPLHCPRCESPFDPQDYSFRVRSGYTDDETNIAGGAVFRFAIEIDCGKCFPKSTVEFSSEFRALCSEVLQCDFIEIENVH